MTHSKYDKVILLKSSIWNSFHIFSLGNFIVKIINDLLEIALTNSGFEILLFVTSGMNTVVACKIIIQIVSCSVSLPSVCIFRDTHYDGIPGRWFSTRTSTCSPEILKENDIIFIRVDIQNTEIPKIPLFTLQIYTLEP